MRNLLHALDRAELEAAFRRHAQALRTPPAAAGDERPVIALDGKTMKRSFDHLNDRAAAVTLSAFACDDALVLAHTEVEADRDEIVAAQQMITEMDVSGVLFTADALHCQKNAGGRPTQRQRPARPGEGQPGPAQDAPETAR